MNNSIQFKRECEAKQWLSYVKQYGRSWWTGKKAELIKKRGYESVNELCAEMNRQSRRVEE